MSREPRYCPLCLRRFPFPLRLLVPLDCTGSRRPECRRRAAVLAPFRT